MAKKNKYKSKKSMDSNTSFVNFGGEIFRNSFAVGDDVDPRESLNYLKEVFREKLEADVVTMIFSECAYNVDQTFETLIALSNDADTSKKTLSSNYPLKARSFSSVGKLMNQSSNEINAKQELSEFSQSSTNSSLISHNTPHESQEFSDTKRNISSLDSFSQFGISLDKTLQISDADETLEKQSSATLSKPKANLFIKSLEQKGYNSKHSISNNNNQTLNCDYPMALENDFITKNSKMFSSPPFYFNKESNSKCESPIFSYGEHDNRRSSVWSGDFHQFISPLAPMSKKSMITNARCFSSIKNPENNNGKSYSSPSVIKQIKTKEVPQDLFQNSAKAKNIVHELKNNLPILVILRGLPGSGKSTLGRELVRFSGVIFSTDDYFVIRGKYQFDSKKLSEAHEWNKGRTAAALEKGITPIVIDNTNTQSWEMKPYVALGIKYKYEIRILEPNTPWKFKPGQLARKTLHKVSKEKIEKMLQRYEHGVTEQSIVESMVEDSSSDSNSQPQSNFQDNARDNSKPQNFSANDKRTSNQNSDKFKLCNSFPGKANLICLKAVVHREDGINQIPRWIDGARSNNEQVLPPENYQPANPLENLKRGITNVHASVNISKEIVENGILEDKVLELSEIRKKAFRGGQKITDLNDLKVLIQQDSEESLSFSRHTSSSDSNQDVAGWEALTEHDDDFLWTDALPVAENKLSEIEETIEYNNAPNEAKDFVVNEQQVKTDVFSVQKQINCSENENQNSHQEFEFSQDLYQNTPQKSDDSLTDIKSDNIVDNFDILPQAIAINHLNKNSTQPSSSPKPQRQQAKSYKQNIVNTTNQIGLVNTNSEFIIGNHETTEFNWTPLEDVDSAKLTWDNESQTWNNTKTDAISDTPKPQRQTENSNSPHFVKSVVKELDSSHSFMENTSEPVDVVPQENVYPIGKKTHKSNKRKLAAKFTPVLCNLANIDGNWKFPEFVTGEVTSHPELELNKNIISVSSSETQTEPNDFLMLHKIETDNLSIMDMKTLVPNITKHKTLLTDVNKEISINEEIPRVPSFDKSSSTENMPDDIESCQKLKILMDCFPDISHDDLKHLLGMCHGDSTWLSNILHDWGYKYNVQNNKVDDIPTLKIIEESDLIKNDSIIQQPIVDDGYGRDFKMESKVNFAAEFSENNFHEEKLSELSEHIPCLEKANIFPHSTCAEKTSEHQFGIEEKLKSDPNLSVIPQHLQLQLDPVFANQLENLFGPVGSNCTLAASSLLSRTIEIDIDLARLIHQSWKGSVVKDQASSITSDITDTHNDEAYGSTLLEDKYIKVDDVSYVDLPDSKSHTSSPFKVANEPLPLAEIMDIEFALQLHKEEKLKSAQFKNLATKLKRLELYEMFPGVDTIALDEVFESNNCSITHTLAALEEDIGKPAKLQEETNLDKSQDKDSHWKRSNLLKDFINDDYSDWVHGDFAIGLDQTTESFVSPEAENLRAEATHHYHLRQECIKKAQTAYRSGQKEVASFYAQKGQLHGSKFKEANNKASELILQTRNSSLDPTVLDLHGLYVQEAIPILVKFLRTKKAELLRCPIPEKSTVSIITGRGAHSIRGAKLRPSVMNYLKSAGYRGILLRFTALTFAAYLNLHNLIQI